MYKNKILVNDSATKEVKLYGETFILSPMSFGRSCSILSKSVKVDFGSGKKGETVKPDLDLGQNHIHKLLAILKSWSLVDDETKQPIPINEETVNLLTEEIGNKLIEEAGKMDEKVEDDLKN